MASSYVSGRPLNILQLITDRDRRGAQVFAVDLAGGLRGLGATVETLALIEGTHGDLLSVRALGARRLGPSTLRTLRRVARGFDVVIAHGSSTLPASVIGLMGTKLPIVYRQISDPTVWAASWSRRLRVAALLRQTTAIAALSTSIAMTLKRYYWLRVRPAVTVIPNAAPAERFRPAIAEERSKARTILGLPVDSQVILCIGALSPEKGVDFAIRAVAEVPAAVLVIVGDGSQRSDLEALAEQLMPGRCFFAGTMEDTQLAYWAADLLVLPSLTEAMPAVLIEAGFCRLASVATDVGAIREVIQHGTTGLVVPKANTQALVSAVSELLGDPRRRLAMGVAAAERCSERFTIERIAQMWLALLSSLCGTRL